MYSHHGINVFACFLIKILGFPCSGIFFFNEKELFMYRLQTGDLTAEDTKCTDWTAPKGLASDEIIDDSFLKNYFMRKYTILNLDK